MSFALSDLKDLLSPKTSFTGIVVTVKGNKLSLATPTGIRIVQGEIGLKIGERVLVENGFARKSQISTTSYPV